MVTAERASAAGCSAGFFYPSGPPVWREDRLGQQHCPLRCWDPRLVAVRRSHRGCCCQRNLVLSPVGRMHRHRRQTPCRWKEQSALCGPEQQLLIGGGRGGGRAADALFLCSTYEASKMKLPEFIWARPKAHGGLQEKVGEKDSKYLLM